MNLQVKKISRIAIPFLTGVGLSVLLTSIFMAGGKRQNLAAVVESFFIERALIFAEHPAREVGKVKTVTLKETELLSFAEAPRAAIKDAHISVYANILRIVLEARPKLVILNWLHGAHYDEIAYIQPLLKVIDENQAKDIVLLAFPNIYATLAPKELTQNYRIVPGQDCLYDVNLYCSVPEGWTTWIPTIFVNDFWQKRRRFAVSYNLPHILPNFLVNVPQPDSIPDISFTDLIKNGADVLGGSELVTIGADLVQSDIFAASKDEIQKTYIAISRPRSDLMRDGLPYHRFWASMAQMFIEDSTIAVVPRIVSLGLAFVVSLFIIFILIKVNSGFALIIYVTTGLCYFALNLIGVRCFHFYIPIFDVLYFGLVTVVFAAFFSISSAIYRQYALALSRDSMSDILDLKQNFISLISHNLNTPVAKLKGLIDVLTMRQMYKQAQQKIDALKVVAVTIQYLVRTVLLTSSLEQRSLQRRSQTLVRLKEELSDYLRQYDFAFDLKYHIQVDDHADSFHQTAEFEPKFFLHAILASLVVHRLNHSDVLAPTEIRISVADECVIFSLGALDISDATHGPFAMQASQNYLREYFKFDEVRFLQKDDRSAFVIQSNNLAPNETSNPPTKN